MTKYTLAIYSQCHEVLYSPASASQLARVSLDFLRECEREGLIRPQMMAHGEYGYPITEIRQLARIRRLCDSFALDLAAVEVILYLRQQVVALIEQLNQLEQQKNSCEQELLNEIQVLRYRLADEVDWNADRE
jgi:DNA-binding transcriptional MerR regulator